MKVYLVQKGKVISSRDKFSKDVIKQFYPLAHTQMKVIEWKHLRQGKGPNIQAYTQEFKNKALSLGCFLETHETLMRYIGGLHSYLRYTILMFIPTNIYKVSIQATHLEASKGKHARKDKDPFKCENKLKGKWKSKKSTTVKKVEGHEESQCWKLHPEL
jgi:hypothetical protein